MTQVYCSGCDDFREATPAEVRRLDQGDVMFRCKECRDRIPKVRNA